MAAASAIPAMAVPPPAMSPGRLVWRRFRRNPAALVGLGLLLGLSGLIVALLPWALRAYDDIPLPAVPAAGDELDALLAELEAPLGPAYPLPPDGRYWLGTDAQGRDYLARIVFGGALSLSIGLAAAAVAIVIGTTWGLVAGFVGGRVDAVMMRIVDVLYGLPYLLLAAILTALYRPVFGNYVVFIAIGAVSWLTMARVIRGEVLSLRARPFVEAAIALGVPRWRIILTHILPNLVGTIAVYATLLVPQVILEESFLSFLGLGVAPDTPTWGALATTVTSLNTVKNDWWLILPPCVCLAVTLLSLNFLGDGLRDALDPRARR